MCCTFLALPSIIFFLSLFWGGASSGSWFQSIAPQKLKLLFRNFLFGLGKNPMYWMLSKAHRSPKQECRSKTVQQLQLLSDLAWGKAPSWRGGGGGGRGEKRGETAKKYVEQCSFPSPDSHSTRFRSPIFFPLFFPVRSLVPGCLRSESGDNTNQLCNVSISCNWGPLLL